MWRFWQEIRKDHLSVEFKHSNGLGVILLNEELPGWLLSITAEDLNRTLTITPFARNLFEALGNRALEVSQSYVLQGALERAEEQLVERQREWHSLDAENKALQEALAKAEELLVKGQQEWHSALAKAEELLVERQQEWHSVDAQNKALQRALAEADDLLMKRLQEWHSLDAQMRLAQEALATDCGRLTR